MKHIYTIIAGILILISFSNVTVQENQVQLELVENQEIFAQINNQTSLGTVEFASDTTIGIISLLNTRNIDEYLGENVMDRLTDEPFYNTSVFSSDKKQRLTLYFHPGSIRKEFSEFKVEYANQVEQNAITTNDSIFETESGIKLGMSISDLRLIKGDLHGVTNNEMTVLHYKIDDFENSDFLKKYNMPVYYAEYIFMNGYLIKFSFGFEYP